MLSLTEPAENTEIVFLAWFFEKENPGQQLSPAKRDNMDEQSRTCDIDSIKLVYSMGVMNGFPRERESNLIRFPLSGNLIKKLCALCELE
jgi:hypothetical protein